MASFKRFAELPKELRDMIWDYASQRNLGGVQIFELRTPKPTEGGETSETTALGTRPLRQQLDAPLRSKCFPALDSSPGTSNVSRYMADIGLWTACKESREVIEKTTQRSKKILEILSKEKHWYYRWEKHVPAIISCSNSQRFLVQPHTDLFVIQPSEIGDIDWSQVARDIRKQIEPRGFAFGINIGIEWNAEWGIRNSRDDFDLLCEAFHDVRAELWIIDHNLKWRKEIDREEQDNGKQIFYACDRRLIEVNWNHEPSSRWQHIKPPERKCKYTGKDEDSIDLVNSLKREADDQIWEWRRSGQYGEDEDRRFYCEVKLLGWDDL